MQKLEIHWFCTTQKNCVLPHFRLSASCYAMHYEPLTQVVEYLTFNQEVASSNLAWLIGTVLISLFICAKLLFQRPARLVFFLGSDDALVDDCGSVVRFHWC